MGIPPVRCSRQNDAIAVPAFYVFGQYVENISVFGFFGKMANSSKQILPIFLSIKQRCIFFMHYVGGRHDGKAAPLTRRFGCSRAMPDSSMHP
jgi:hypothetical protein